MEDADFSGLEEIFRERVFDGNGTVDLLVANWRFKDITILLNGKPVVPVGGCGAGAIFLMNWLFHDGPPPPPPSDESGLDPTDDNLTCAR